MKNKITIKDLKKDRLKALKNNEKEKALTIMMLIDTIEKMAKVKNSDPNQNFIIGDSWKDMKAGLNAGLPKENLIGFNKYNKKHKIIITTN